MPFFGPLQPFSLCSSLLTLPSSLAMFHDCVPSLSLFSTHTSHASLMRQGPPTCHRKRTWRCPSCDAADDSILEPSKAPTVGLTYSGLPSHDIELRFWAAAERALIRWSASPVPGIASCMVRVTPVCFGGRPSVRVRPRWVVYWQWMPAKSVDCKAVGYCFWCSGDGSINRLCSQWGVPLADGCGHVCQCRSGQCGFSFFGQICNQGYTVLRLLSFEARLSPGRFIPS